MSYAAFVLLSISALSSSYIALRVLYGDIKAERRHKKMMEQSAESLSALLKKEGVVIRFPEGDVVQ